MDLTEAFRILRMYPESTEVRDADTFLLTHREEAVERIRSEGLSKFDEHLGSFLGDVGSPLADPALPELMRLLADLNWPAYAAARDAVFRFAPAAIAAAIDELVAGREYDVVDCFSREALHQRPPWLLVLRPAIEKAAQAARRATDSTAEDAHDHLCALAEALMSQTDDRG